MSETLLSAALLKPVGKTKFMGQPIRLYGSADEPLFMVEEIRPLLGFEAKAETLVRNHPSNEKTVRLVDALSFADKRPRSVWFVNEPGLYRLIFKSRRPEAEALKTFIFTEVMPCLRRYGKYPVKNLPAAEPLKLTPALAALMPLEPEFQTLCLRQQTVVAMRLQAVREIELAPTRSLTSRCKRVAARQKGMGWAWVSIYRFHARWCQSGRDWRALKIGKPPGRAVEKLLTPCCGTKEQL